MISLRQPFTSGWRRLRRAALRALYGPRLRTDRTYPTIRLGSAYGGWTFVPLPSLPHAVVVSAGAGEDVTFDVELATQFGCRVILVDPTPRAVQHFRDLERRIGEAARVPYSPGGCQNVDAYDLSSIAPGQLQLDGRALTGTSGTVRFYAPKDPADVSYSIVNFQNDYATDTEWIDVPSVSVKDLLETLGVADVELLKLDIEGAEIEVIPAILDHGVRPRQILVEYDELNWPSPRSKRNFDRVHAQLVNVGYVVTAFDRRSCVSYLDSVAAAHWVPTWERETGL